MSGIGLGQKHNNLLEHANKVGQMIKHMIIAKPTMEIRTLVEELVDSGLYEKKQSVPTCSNCTRVISENDKFCPYCGAVDGDYMAQIMDDEEGDNDDDSPVHREMEENKIEMPVQMDVAQRFSEMLEELGWPEPDAETGGNIMAKIWDRWEKGKPFDEKIYRTMLTEVTGNYDYVKMLEDQVVQNRLPVLFGELLADEEKVKRDTLIAEVRIYRNEVGKWSFWVNDPLRDVYLTNPRGWINLGDNKNPIFLTAQKTTQDLIERRDKITSLVRSLFQHRQNFFEAGTTEEAEEIILNEHLHQDTIAKEAGIPTTTLSRWCQQGAITISTPHGTYQLADFFKRASKRKTEEGYETRDLTPKAIKDLIMEIEIKISKEADQKEFLNILKQEYGIEMSERTLRHHKQANRAERL